MLTIVCVLRLVVVVLVAVLVPTIVVPPSPAAISVVAIDVAHSIPPWPQCVGRPLLDGLWPICPVFVVRLSSFLFLCLSNLLPMPKPFLIARLLFGLAVLVPMLTDVVLSIRPP